MANGGGVRRATWIPSDNALRTEIHAFEMATRVMHDTGGHPVEHQPTCLRVIFILSHVAGRPGLALLVARAVLATGLAELVVEARKWDRSVRLRQLRHSSTRTRDNLPEQSPDSAFNRPGTGAGTTRPPVPPDAYESAAGHTGRAQATRTARLHAYTRGECRTMTDAMKGQTLFPFPPGQMGEPPAELDSLRAKCPVSRVTLPSGDAAWVVSGRDEVVAALTDSRLSRAALREPGAPRVVPGPDFGDNPYSLFNLEGAEHSRLRQLIAPAFSRRRAEVLRPRVQEITDGLIGRLTAQSQPIDLYREFCELLPIWVVCEIVGAPLSDRERIKRWTETLMRVGSDGDRLRARTEFIGYVRDLVALRRSEPKDDVLSELIMARDDIGGLSEAEMHWLGAELLLAGHDTTVNTLGRGIFQLLRHREQWELLTAHPDELTNMAVEEVFRYAPPSDVGLMRVALDDLTIGDTQICKGEGVIPLMHATARDERHVPHPERFDITRPHSMHLVFGHGPHFCPGQAVARMELQVAFGTLARRLPGLRLAVPPDQVRWIGGHITLRAEAIPVTL